MVVSSSFSSPLSPERTLGRTKTRSTEPSRYVPVAPVTDKPIVGACHRLTTKKIASQRILSDPNVSSFVTAFSLSFNTFIAIIACNQFLPVC